MIIWTARKKLREMLTSTNIEKHKAFWKGEGPSLILVPAARKMDEVWHEQIYDTRGYRQRFYSPEKMWEAEMERARPVLDWPTDGIATVRPNLGTIFIPTMAGQSYHVQDGQMPWAGEPLEADMIRASREVDVSKTELMLLAAEFYRIHSARVDEGVAAYHPNTEGVFDIAHLLYGDRIFYELADKNKAEWVEELLEICLNLYVNTSRYLKTLLAEETVSMVHGLGTEQGVYFPHAGVSMSEDTATLISPAMIQQFILPIVERAAKPFGGAFVHYCGQHKVLFEELCRMECVRAIDLGNPEMYDTRWLLERCAETGTVLYSRLAAEPQEKWEVYVRRVARIVRETGARCILRPLSFPETREQCAAMQALWHELTV